ncbi:MAG: hypothetical protein K2X87_33115 [Gemmataceae bacterium]|nr:hypothetical protein [Gemmataceae bacterium]
MTVLRLTAAALIASAGCSGPGNAPVDPEAAREALRAALDSWKRGEKADALQAASPPVYVIDAEWQGGAGLKDYRLAGDGEAADANLFCPVVLTVRTPGGAEVVRPVTYIVSTAPNRTVTRKVF